MKLNQKIILTMIGILATTSFVIPVLADEEASITTNNFQAERQARKEALNDKKDEMEMKRTETKARIEEKKGEMQQKRTELKEKRQERFQRISTGITTKIENVISRLEDSQINTTTIKTYLDELEARNALVEKAASSLDTAYDSADKELIKEEQVNLKVVVKNLRDYYQTTLRPAIKEAILKARSELTN